LIANAIKYTFKGTIKIFVNKIQNQDKDIDLIEFIVEDKGTGIKKEDIPNLFKMYTMTENYKITKAKGSGLGLNISSKIAEQLTYNKKIEV